MTYRRKLRSTQDLVFAVWRHLEGPGFTTERLHLARLPYDLVDQAVRAVLEVGRRRGRSELALELFDRSGLAVELGGAPPLPAMTLAPLLREPAAPAFVMPELTTRVEIPGTEKRSGRGRKS